MTGDAVPLAGKVALITGAGTGIGAAAARLMSRHGAAIAVVGLPGEAVESVAAEIEAGGGRAIAIAADVSDATAMQAAVRETAERLDRLDVVVASAGIQMHREDRDLHDMDDAVWDCTHAVNYRGVYLTCKHALARMVAQGEGGAIVIIASVTSLRGFSPNVAYSSGKTGLLGLNRHIAVHYAKQGIRCNAVCPGALLATPNHDRHPDPEGRARAMAARIPAGRLGTPEDVASVVDFLAGPGAAYVTGAEVVVDGGMTVV